jgi:hypothetical protein
MMKKTAKYEFLIIKIDKIMNFSLFKEIKI